MDPWQWPLQLPGCSGSDDRQCPNARPTRRDKDRSISEYLYPEAFSVIQHNIRLIHRGANSMTNASRATMMIRLLAFGVLIFAATSWAQTRPPILEKIAKTYGIDSFGQIEAIRYTF